MKRHHATFVLLSLFFTGLLVLWWTDYAGYKNSDEVRVRQERILPALMDVKPGEIRRVEISRTQEGDRIAFERRDGRWQMVKPVDAGADPMRIEALIRNLMNLRKSPDAGTIRESPSRFGLAPPAEVVRLYGAGNDPVAALEFGKVVRERRYCRPSGREGIEVVDARLFQELDAPANDWRDKTVFSLSSFQVTGLTVTRPGHPELRIGREEGHWKLMRPLDAPADDEKVEGVVAELVALRVAEGDHGFVADDVKDFVPYGLDDTSAMKIELVPNTRPTKPQLLFVGKDAPVIDDRHYAYARRADQDDVILIDLKDQRDLGTRPNALRGQRVADINPRRVESIRIEQPGRVFELTRTPTGWKLVQPTEGKADTASVQALVLRLGELRASEFLEPEAVVQPDLEPPLMTLEVKQATGPKDKVVTRLQLGRHDALRKTVYARIEGDPTRAILAIPDNFLEVLPKDAFAFRDRSVASLSPAQVSRLTITRGGRTVVLAVAGSSDQPNHWRMLGPVEAPTNDEAVTSALTLLSDLRAESFISDAPGEAKAFGLDAPTLSVSWTTEPDSAAPKTAQTAPKTTTLRVGSKDPRTGSFFASLTGQPLIFTLKPSTLLPFEAEFHTPRVLSFPAGKAERLVLRWPGRRLSFVPQPGVRGGPTKWRPEPGIDISGFDLSRLDPLVSDLSRLKTQRFDQYDGAFPAESGLSSPRLAIEVDLSGQAPRELRVGNTRTDGTLFATTATGSSGPVFFLAGPAWTSLVDAFSRGGELPTDVFAPGS
ncbi:MAG: DUF4340 domain-containing protein [Planctomycetaceae bacterium]|nr:DUF4340 domain-containing protein [Planctomycetaceae bacterium]